jgi:predicted amidohydrolase YtcJ
MNAPQIVSWVNVSGPPVGPVTSIEDIVTTIRAFMDERRPAPGEWVIGYGYDPTVLSDGRELTRDDLDPHFPDHPIMLIHVSNHGCVLNSAGFALNGIDENTPTPEGGVILRKEGSNEPAGLLMETAFLPIFANMPQPRPGGRSSVCWGQRRRSTPRAASPPRRRARPTSPTSSSCCALPTRGTS